jgi:hypothetical protein
LGFPNIFVQHSRLVDTRKYPLTLICISINTKLPFNCGWQATNDPHYLQTISNKKITRKPVPLVGYLYLTLDHLISFLSLSIINASAAACNSLQHSVHRHISISHVSILSSILDLTILEFILSTMNLRKQLSYNYNYIT